jgi:hypothetical protein
MTIKKLPAKTLRTAPRGAVFPAIFERLKKILEPYAEVMLVVRDDPDFYHLDLRRRGRRKKTSFVAAVKIHNGYVSFYLMPVYEHPGLVEGISDDLRKRMQGKSCFNFTEVDEALFEELADLTRAALG